MDGKTILLVDDDLTLREMYEERLQAEGFQIVQASNGDEALSKAREIKPNIILLDVMMPKINGFDVLKELKANADLKDVPVIILTALIQDVDRAQGRGTTRQRERDAPGSQGLEDDPDRFAGRRVVHRDRAEVYGDGPDRG